MINEDIRIIGLKIKNQRKKIGLTQKELAKKVSLSNEWICKIECGNVSNINFNSLCRICDVLKLDYKDVLTF